jgi:large conductance mechanosensitive channel
MSVLKEFKDFATKGNVIDLAVGVIIGGAFGKIVSSFVADIMMPVINPLIPGGDWRTIELWHGVKVGNFLGAVVDFIIVAFVIFLFIKTINRNKKKEVAKPAEPSKQEILLTEIRDILKQK